MRRFSLALIGSAFYAVSAIAAEPGTYRPGNAYNSVPANSADICELQCAGDAQCRSWNFIRVSRMNEGVCEFNESNVAPVPSEISTSGQNVSRRGSTLLVSGRTNTRRIGTPEAPASVTQASPARRVVREALPARVQPRAAAHLSAPARAPAAVPAYGPRNPQHSQHLSLTEQQNLNRQRASANTPAQVQPYARQPLAAYPAAPRQMFRHSLEEGRAAPQPQMPPASRFPQADPRLKQSVQQASLNPVMAARPPATSAHPQAGTQIGAPQIGAPQGGLSAPPGVPPMAASQQPSYAPAPSRPILAGQPAPMPSGAPAQAFAPNPQAQTHARQQAQMQGRAQAAAQRRVHIPNELAPRPMGAAEATESLFGSLYDDVKIPAPVDPSQINDPNAPIPTVASVPSGKIMSGPLPPVR
jgi:hypothetical protein